MTSRQIVQCQLVIVLVSGGRMLKNVVPLPTIIISLLLNNHAVKWRLPAKIVLCSGVTEPGPTRAWARASAMFVFY